MGKGGVDAISTGTDIILKLKRTMFTQASVYMLLQLQFLVFSSTEELTCSVTRVRTGDRMVFVDYSGTCNRTVNPCQRIVGSEWRYSANGCTCRCSELTSTYREDSQSCIVNKLNREGCTLLFSKETDADSLRVFNNSSSIKLAALPKEACVAKETYFMSEELTTGWTQFSADTHPFYIHHKDRKMSKHAHFLQWSNGRPVAELFGKIVKVNVQCEITKGEDTKMPRKLCVVFKVKGTISIPCPAGFPSRSPPTDTTARQNTVTMIIRNNTETTQKPFTDVFTVTKPNKTPVNPSIVDKGGRETHNVDKKVALPIWLIGVIAGGAVIATLAVTAIIWLCCKMKHKHRRRRKKRSHKASPGNPLYNNDDTVITFAPSGDGPRVDEAGYAKVGSPCRKGYAFLSPAPERTRSEYQRLMKPGEDHSGYLLPMEERTATATTTTAADVPSTADSVIYSEAQSPPEQDKTKDKEYDYAKPEDVICITASRSSLDNLDLHADSEQGYTQSREHNEDTDNGPSAPFYATVEGPSSPEVTPEEGPSGVPPEGTLAESGLDDHRPYYVELLPDESSESGGSLIKEDCEVEQRGC